jgi:hypothetical protein
VIPASNESPHWALRADEWTEWEDDGSQWGITYRFKHLYWEIDGSLAHSPYAWNHDSHVNSHQMSDDSLTLSFDSHCASKNDLIGGVTDHYNPGAFNLSLWTLPSLDNTQFVSVPLDKTKIDWGFGTLKLSHFPSINGQTPKRFYKVFVDANRENMEVEEDYSLGLFRKYCFVAIVYS